MCEVEYWKYVVTVDPINGKYYLIGKNTYGHITPTRIARCKNITNNHEKVWCQSCSKTVELVMCFECSSKILVEHNFDLCVSCSNCMDPKHRGLLSKLFVIL